VKLSPAAKCFVPESFTLSTKKSSVTSQHCGLSAMSQLPRYVTSCYPFVNYDYARNLQ